MMLTILRKEYREHRSVWLALACVSALLIVGVASAWGFAGHSGAALRDSMRAVALILAWTYGVVCGSMLLAGERENGTQPFLDTLPTGRWPLYWCKVAAGVLFVLAQVAVIAALGTWADLTP